MIFAPKVSAESSIKCNFSFEAIFLSFFQSAILPIRFGTRIALVFLVIFFLIKSGLICKVLTFTSTKTGTRSFNIIDETAVPKFKQGVITSLPFFKFKHFKANINAEDPELTITPYFLPKIFAILFSKVATDTPICVVFFKVLFTANISSLL